MYIMSYYLIFLSIFYYSIFFTFKIKILNDRYKSTIFKIILYFKILKIFFSNNFIYLCNDILFFFYFFF